MGKVIHAAFSGESRDVEGFGRLRPRNADVRPREYLTEPEVERLAAAARKGRHGLRDFVLTLTLYRHALRASEASGLQWSHVHFGRLNSIDIHRAKKGIDSTHPLAKDEVRQLHHLRREYPEARYLFESERGGPMSEDAIHNVIQRSGRVAAFPFPIHPHMMRHSRLFKLARESRDVRAIQIFAGHRRLESTLLYMSADASRFDGFTD